MCCSTPSRRRPTARRRRCSARTAPGQCRCRCCRSSTPVRLRSCSARWSSRTATPTPTCATACSRGSRSTGASWAGHAAASLTDASALFAQDPGSLVYGAWNTHRKGRQQKFARVYASEIVGWDPVVGDRNAGRMDPLNLRGRQGTARRRGVGVLPCGDQGQGGEAQRDRPRQHRAESQHGGVTIIRRSARQAVAGRPGSGRVRRVSAEAASRPGHIRRVRAAGRPARRSADRRCGCAAGVSWCWSPNGSSGSAAGAAPRIALPRRGRGAVRVGHRARSEQGLPLATETVSLTPSKPLAQAIDFSLTKADRARTTEPCQSRFDRMLTGSYDAAEADDREHGGVAAAPARLFCALVAAARGEDDRAALRWLETQPAPLISRRAHPRGAPVGLRRGERVKRQGRQPDPSRAGRTGYGSAPGRCPRSRGWR